MRELFIKSLLHFLAALPLPVTHTIATWLGQWIARRPAFRITSVTQTNIRLCFPHLSEEAQTELVTHSLIETCKTFSELGTLWLRPPQQVLKLVRHVSGEESLQHALQQGQGVILLTPHLGAWEMAGLYVSSHYPLTALYRPLKLAGLHDLIYTARQRAGGRFMPTDQTGVRALYQALRRGDVVGILPDQVPSQVGTGVFAPFFGIPAYTIVLVSRFAQKTGSPVIYTFAERLPKGQGFHLCFLPAPKEIASENLAEAVTALNQGIEQCVQTCLAQYQWSYKRFKVRPAGEEEVYE